MARLLKQDLTKFANPESDSPWDLGPFAVAVKEPCLQPESRVLRPQTLHLHPSEESEVWECRRPAPQELKCLPCGGWEWWLAFLFRNGAGFRPRV